MSKPVFRFGMEAAPHDPAGICPPSWADAYAISVLAESRDDAVKKAAAMLGLGANDKPWVFVIRRIDEVDRNSTQQGGDLCRPVFQSA